MSDGDTCRNVLHVNRLLCRITIFVASACATIGPLRAAPADRVDAHQSATSSADQLPPELLALLASQPAWTTSVHLEAASGYNDNLLLSQSNPERSGFVRGGVQSLLWHIPQHRTDYFVFCNAEGTRFFSGKSVRGEGQAFAGLEWRYRWEDSFSFTIDPQGYYLDQIFDISDTSIQRVVAELKVTGGKIGPTFRWNSTHGMWFEGSLKVARESLDEIVVASGAETRDRTRVVEPSMRLAWQPSERFELSVAATERQRQYASHPRYTITGKVDVGVLAIHEFEDECRMVVEWDKNREWKTVTRIGQLRYTDNGSGYLNYTQPFASQEIEWSPGNWMIQAETSARRKTYDHQTENHPGELPGTAILPPLVKEEYSAELRIERKIGKSWTVYSVYQWERTRSNDVIAGYLLNECLLGLRWSWEK